MEPAYIHSCGVVLTAGEFETYRAEKVEMEDEPTHHEFEGTCPACGDSIKPELGGGMVRGFH